MHFNNYRNLILISTAALAGLLGADTARASLIVTAGSATIAAGGSGAFDVTLTNSGPSAALINTFAFDATVNNTFVSLTDATTATAAPYIFGVNGILGSDLTGPNSGQSINVFDSLVSGNVSVAAGASVGLGHVLFTVAQGSATGPFTITLSATSVSDAAGVVTNPGLTNGQITVTSGVPEPSTWLTLAGALFAGVTLRRRRIVR
jgi:hypothetical protein